MKTARELQNRRKQRIRAKLRNRKTDRLRLSVFRSSKHIYAQVIDDTNGVTIAAASTLDKDIRGNGATTEAAAKVGKAIAERSLAAGIKAVAFDRGGYMYHGRVKALGDAAREGGLSF